VIGDELYSLGPRDRTQERIEIGYTGIIALSTGLSHVFTFQVPPDNVLMLKSAVLSAAAASLVDVSTVAVRIAAPDGTSEVSLHLERFGTPQARANVNRDFNDYPVAAGYRVILEAFYSAANAANVSNGSIGGLLIPRGNVVPTRLGSTTAVT
jgi:hypothetical protein